MSGVLARLIALCMLTAVGELLTGNSRLRDGVRLILGLAAAELVLETVLALPAALMG